MCCMRNRTIKSVSSSSNILSQSPSFNSIIFDIPSSEITVIESESDIFIDKIRNVDDDVDADDGANNDAVGDSVNGDVDDGVNDDVDVEFIY